MGVVVNVGFLGVLTFYDIITLNLKGVGPTEFEVIEKKTTSIEPSDTLNKKCYKGELDDTIANKEYYYGALNYLCDIYNKKVTIVTNNEGFEGIPDNVNLATTNINKIVFFSEAIKLMNPNIYEIKHIVFHEYTHLLMLRDTANKFLIQYKSQKIIDSVVSAYNGTVPEMTIYPTLYSNFDSGEQLAEILGYYMAKQVYFPNEVIVTNDTTNFERDLFNQFLVNVGQKKNIIK